MMRWIKIGAVAYATLFVVVAIPTLSFIGWVFYHLINSPMNF